MLLFYEPRSTLSSSSWWIRIRTGLRGKGHGGGDISRSTTRQKASLHDSAALLLEPIPSQRYETAQSQCMRIIFDLLTDSLTRKK